MSPPVRLAEVLGAVSLACDLADGFPLEKALRTCHLAVALGRRRGLSDRTLADIYYATLFRYLGCVAFTHEEAHVYGAGDDIAVRNTMSLADIADPLGTLAAVASRIGKGAGLAKRVASVVRLLLPSALARHAASQCESTVRFAALAGMSPGVVEALGQICERYDGRGLPGSLRGEAISEVIRYSHIADVVEIAHHRGGREAARAVATRRKGGQFDPALCAVFLADSDALLLPLEATSVWQAFLDAEPGPPARLSGSRLDDLALVVGRMADLKSIFTLGHSEGVATLVERAAGLEGLSEAAVRKLKLAAHFHDLGRLSVPTGIWDKPSALGAAEWERVRLHAYYTGRILHQSEGLRPLAALAGEAHERPDGSGYPKGGASEGFEAALLSAADAYHALTEARPHRPARSGEEAAAELRAEAAAGKRDASAVEAVLQAAGEPASNRVGPARGAKPADSPPWPAGLTDREIDVLRHLAAGRSNKEIASRLRISPRTVQHHVIHIYGKIGGSSRATAALFALEHGLLRSSAGYPKGI